MYKIVWDKKTGGVLLTSNDDGADTILLPRPVFYEELDLLGFDKHWQYPNNDSPLLWANGRRYYYKGEWVAEAKGGNIFNAPELVFYGTGAKLSLKPVHLNQMLRKNQEAIFVLENEAMDFVEHAYKTYRNKVDYFAVSFSGGKDSQVVLDIVSRIIPPDEYIVVFTDTDMELPSTHEHVGRTKKYYTSIYPTLKFETAKSLHSSLDLWQKFGPPSRIQRWCCSVCKTSPFARFIKQASNGIKQPKVLVFEGIRNDESVRREGYKRIASGVKHINIINSRPIISWNETEVFMYLFHRNIFLNKAYRTGLTRVGCGICPFASEWSDYMVNKLYPDFASNYLQIIKKYMDQIGVKDKEKASKYLIEGQWKKRAGGKGLNADSTRVDFIQNKAVLEAVISNPKEDFVEWLKTMGDIICKTEENKIVGGIKTNGDVCSFELEKKTNTNKTIIRIKISDHNNYVLLSRLKNIIYKTAFCVHCGTCEAECPTGALQVIPKVKVNSNICVACANCNTFTDRGCLLAKSVIISSGGGEGMNLKSSSIDRYSTFGMKKEWVDFFFNNPAQWFVENNLGPKQVDAMVNWLKDAELMERKDKKITQLCKILQNIYSRDEILAWTIMWVNLFYNSTIIKWYILHIERYKEYSKNALMEMLRNSFENLSEGTINNPLTAITTMFENSPYGKELKFGIVERKGNKRYVQRYENDEVSPIAVAYSLYRYAKSKNRHALTVDEFYKNKQDEGPYRLFLMSKERLENTLRYLQENKSGIIKVDLTKGLDNINLREDLDYIDILKLLL